MKFETTMKSMKMSAVVRRVWRRRRGGAFRGMALVIAVAGGGLSGCDFFRREDRVDPTPPVNVVRPAVVGGESPGRRIKPPPVKPPVQPVKPPVQARTTEVRAYHFNNGRWDGARFIDDGEITEDRQPPEGALLSDAEVRDLKAAITADEIKEVPVVDFRPQLAFVTYDGDRVEQCIEVCVPCDRACVLKPGVHGRREIEMDMDIVKRIAAKHRLSSR